MSQSKVIAVDFDGTIVDHLFPEIGDEVPDAPYWLLAFQAAGAKLILWTMRSDGAAREGRKPLTEAVEWCRERGIEFWGINENPDQKTLTESPKCYAHIYIDDAAFGCPLLRNVVEGARPYVNWSEVGPKVMEWLLQKDKT